MRREMLWALPLFGVLGCGQHAATDESPPAAHTAKAAHPSARASAGPARWTYDGENGPEAWGSIAPETAACAGRRQSPIDLLTATPRGKLSRVAFNYQPTPLVLRHNGHVIQGENKARSSIFIGPRRRDFHELVRYEIHSPSEHTIDGEPFDLEVQLVHKNVDGELAVVSLLFRAGEESPALAPIVEHAPAEESEKAARVPGATLDLGKLIPPGGAYFRYPGSLTAPPCTDGVSWIVMSTILEASQDQIDRLVEQAGGPTSRPVQPTNGRRVQRFAP